MQETSSLLSNLNKLLEKASLDSKNAMLEVITESINKHTLPTSPSQNTDDGCPTDDGFPLNASDVPEDLG